MILAGVFTATLTTIMTGEENEEISIMQRNLEEKLAKLEKTQTKILKELKNKVKWNMNHEEMDWWWNIR